MEVFSNSWFPWDYYDSSQDLCVILYYKFLYLVAMEATRPSFIIEIILEGSVVDTLVRKKWQNLWRMGGVLGETKMGFVFWLLGDFNMSRILIMSCRGICLIMFSSLACFPPGQLITLFGTDFSLQFLRWECVRGEYCVLHGYIDLYVIHHRCHMLHISTCFIFYF